MSELDAMVDESGRWGKLSKYHPITLMFRDQSKPVNPHIERYEQHLADASLPDIPFHAGPLFNGHDDYEIPSTTDRKRLFIAFFTLARNPPFTYVTFAHRRSEFDGDKNRFEAQLKRDLAAADADGDEDARVLHAPAPGSLVPHAVHEHVRVLGFQRAFPPLVDLLVDLLEFVAQCPGWHPLAPQQPAGVVHPACAHARESHLHQRLLDAGFAPPAALDHRRLEHGVVEPYDFIGHGFRPSFQSRFSCASD